MHICICGWSLYHIAVKGVEMGGEGGGARGMIKANTKDGRKVSCGGGVGE